MTTHASTSRTASRLTISVLYNEPVLARESRDWASEAGVLETVEAVRAALQLHGHHLRLIPVKPPFDKLLAELTEPPVPDAVFNLCEGLEGTGHGESQVASLVELCGAEMTGSRSECLALVRDKPRTKWLLEGAGLPTPDFFMLEPSDALPAAELAAALARSPWIVKPAREDASLGIGPESVVTSYDALVRAVDGVRRRYGPVLIEQFIPGREFNVGILDVGGPRLLPLAEIMFDAQAGQAWQLVSYDAKWSPESPDFLSTPVRCPADVEPALADEIGRIALSAFRVTGCRDYARIDLRLDQAGRPWILEVNANPDLSPSAGLARALGAAGLSFDAVVHDLACQAVVRRELRMPTPASAQSSTG